MTFSLKGGSSLLALLLASKPSPAPTQQAFMVWDKTCITEVKTTERLYMDAPMVDGKPDLKQARLHGVAATYEVGCGRIEVRRVEK